MQLEQVEALVVLGTVRVRAGRSREALEALGAARSAWLELGNPTQAALVELYIANLHLNIAETLEDAEADATYLEAAELAQGRNHDAAGGGARLRAWRSV